MVIQNITLLSTISIQLESGMFEGNGEFRQKTQCWQFKRRCLNIFSTKQTFRNLRISKQLRALLGEVLPSHTNYRTIIR